MGNVYRMRIKTVAAEMCRVVMRMQIVWIRKTCQFIHFNNTYNLNYQYTNCGYPIQNVRHASAS
jgi:hypothetical protein